MISVGFPGIGKTTLSQKMIADFKTTTDVIDLESSYFSKEDPNWYKAYCQAAECISYQGYDVFISSHIENLYYLHMNNIPNVICIYPSITIKDKWLNKLEERYKKSKLDKDLKAFEAAQNFYTTDILNFKNTYGYDTNIGFFEITQMDYNLRNIVENIHKAFVSINFANFNNGIFTIGRQ